MRAALPSPAHSPTVPVATARRGPKQRGALGLALVLALVPLALYARLLFYPTLEISDGSLCASASAGEAVRAGGLGGLLLFLEGCGADSSALPFFSRCVALGLHIGATLLVGALARRLGATRGTSVLAALLFAVHPLRVEAVAWLSQRGVLLGSFFFLLGALLSIADGKLGTSGKLGGVGQTNAHAWRTAGSRAAFVLALLAEPRLLLGLLWLPWVEHRLCARAPTRARVLLDGALLGLASWWLMRSPAPELAPDAPAFLTRLALAPLALGALGWQWCWPAGLSAQHAQLTLASSAPALLAASWLALVLVLVGLPRLQTRWPRGASAVLLFALLGAPHALFPRSAALFSEAAGYAPALGLELLLVFALQAVFTRAPRAAFALAGLVLLACAARTAMRLPDWRSEADLQESALALGAEPRAYDALGQWHLLHGRLSSAQRAHERALLLARQQRGGAADARALLHLGELELRRALIPGQEQHLGRAAQLLEECLAAFPAWASANELLGEVYQRAEQDARALTHLAAAAEHSRSARTHTRLGMLRRRLFDQDGARASFTRAIQLDPRASDAWCGLGLVQLQTDEPDAARTSFERALALEPEHVEARATLARLQELRGERPEAERNLRRALGVNPSYVDGLYTLGMLLSASARPDEALRYLDRACTLPRSAPHVRAQLESARLRMARGEVEVPRQRLRAVLAFNPEQAEARALLERLGADGSAR